MGETAQCWYYHDSQAFAQSPFSASEMRVWFRAGQFDEHKIAHPQRRLREFAKFVQLEILYHDISTEFLDNAIPEVV